METAQDLAKKDTGEGLPVLLVHGWSSSGSAEAYDFEQIFSKKTGYHRIYPDLPGMGNSAIGTTQSLDSMLESISGFIERNILPSNFLLVGTSIGAYIARALAYKYASAIDGLLLRVPVIDPALADRDVDPFKAVVTDDTLLSAMSSNDRKNMSDFSIPMQTQRYVDSFKEKLEATWLPAGTASDSKALNAIRNSADGYKLTSTLHSPEDPFSKPTLVVTGRQDTHVGYRDAWRLIECYPRATFVVLDRAGHGLPVDETALFGALVDNWLNRVEELQKLDLEEARSNSISGAVKKPGV